MNWHGTLPKIHALLVNWVSFKLYWIKKGIYFNSLNIFCSLRFLVCFLRSTEGGFEFVLPVGVLTVNLADTRLKDNVTDLTNSLIFFVFTPG